MVSFHSYLNLYEKSLMTLAIEYENHSLWHKKNAIVKEIMKWYELFSRKNSDEISE